MALALHLEKKRREREVLLNELLSSDPSKDVLHLDGNPFDSLERLSAVIETNTVLTNLSISRTLSRPRPPAPDPRADCHLGENGSALLAQAVARNRTLTSLSLGDCRLGDSGATQWAQVLEKNPVLRSLALSGSCFPE